MLPRHSVPSTLPATRTTKSSLCDWSKISSIGALASEQPRTIPKGRCAGALPSTSEKPSESGLERMTIGLFTSPWRTSPWTFSTIIFCRKFPSRSACMASWDVEHRWPPRA